ncbi:hypothetical protein T492DRAFT_839213 [Pavlovales sp. CCMP2436]|nr:hypothetical protein T492DRAFT_839213 [Pavlovales sp. CCMP2436]
MSLDNGRPGERRRDWQGENCRHGGPSMAVVGALMPHMDEWLRRNADLDLEVTRECAEPRNNFEVSAAEIAEQAYAEQDSLLRLFLQKLFNDQGQRHPDPFPEVSNQTDWHEKRSQGHGRMLRRIRTDRGFVLYLNSVLSCKFLDELAGAWKEEPKVGKCLGCQRQLPKAQLQCCGRCRSVEFCRGTRPSGKILQGLPTRRVVGAQGELPAEGELARALS